MVTYTTSESQELQEKIMAQVEYYFGDSNIRKDKFIRFHSKQNDGWFPVDKLMTFNKLKVLTSDSNLVVDSIKSSELIEVNDDGTKLRRKKPLPEFTEEEKKEFNKRTLHLKGFSKEANFEEIKEFCDKLGKVDFVQMRRYPKDKKFKGCIMVSFVNLEDAEKALNGPELKYNDIELLRESKEKYFERKADWLANRKDKIKENKDQDLIDVKGAILKISGLKKETKFSDIKEELSNYSKVAFVSNVNDNSECMVRFSDEEGAKLALKALKEKAEATTEDDSKLSIDFLEQKLDFTVVSEEEEKEFWREFKSKQSMKHSYNKRKTWTSKRRRNDDRDNNKNKKQKYEGGNTAAAICD